MPNSPRHHLRPDPAAARRAEPDSTEAGVSASSELTIVVALLVLAAVVAAAIGPRDFILLSGGATAGALIVGRMAAQREELRDEAGAAHARR